MIFIISVTKFFYTHKYSCTFLTIDWWYNKVTTAQNSGKQAKEPVLALRTSTWLNEGNFENIFQFLELPLVDEQSYNASKNYLPLNIYKQKIM